MPKSKKSDKKIHNKKTSSKNSDSYYPLSIISFVISLLFFIPFIQIVSLILGIIALVKISKNDKLKGKGFAISAIIISLLILIIYIIFFIFAYALFSLMLNSLSDPQAAVQNCISDNTLFQDTCIFMVVAINANQTSLLPNDICDSKIQDSDTRDMCNSILTKDPTFCEKIKDQSSKNECLNFFKELNNSVSG